MYDVIIIGRGPAGISAAIYTARANLKTLVVAKDYGALAKTDKIENYYGFTEPVGGMELLQNGERQAQRLGAEVVECEVLSVKREEYFTVSTTAGEYESRALILATGTARKKAQHLNLTEFEGRGVSFCAVCDGFFYRGKKVGVLGAGDYALAEAGELSAFTQDIVLLTDGAPLTADFSSFRVEPRRITAVEGGDRLEAVRFEDGGREELAGLFVALGTASALDLARKTGIATLENRIAVDARMKTNIDGLFAAGDVTGGFLQVAKAVGDGAVAAKGVIDYVRRLG
ncbi:NAD(P)/FAD-dependent oxidoreductase [Feifania hominis]|uniref:FAD-dependent oxidoreductase n=1 Tax=Feifania hominis TaxID=2763660 RepID=A0A926DDX6_9FIRM|nr:FAD-dependent oxidoreductase [Feifania hominis]MBC8536067.1 FAD-dependent oxidoreductase [Feifania hominis]